MNHPDMFLTLLVWGHMSLCPTASVAHLPKHNFRYVSETLMN